MWRASQINDDNDQCQGCEGGFFLPALRWLMILIVSYILLHFHTSNYPAGVGVSFLKQRLNQKLCFVWMQLKLLHTRSHTNRCTSDQKSCLSVDTRRSDSWLHAWVPPEHFECKQRARRVYSEADDVPGKTNRELQTQSAASLVWAENTGRDVDSPCRQTSSRPRPPSPRDHDVHPVIKHTQRSGVNTHTRRGSAATC